MIATVTDTVNLGSLILGVLASIAILVGILYGVRYKVSYQAASAAAEELRKSLSDEKDRAREDKDLAATLLRTTQEKHEAAATDLREQLSVAQKTITRLEQMPDMAQLVRLLDQHETRAQERHEATTEVLKELVSSLRSATNTGGITP